MISEIDKLDGATLEVKAELKAFGGSTANITPGPDGIAPLSKQSAFKKEEAIESIDLNTPEPVLEPTEEEKIPSSVEDPSELEGFKMPEIDLPILDEAGPVEEEPKAQDLEMPEMPSEILAQEPQGINETLFATSVTPEPTPKANPEVTSDLVVDSVEPTPLESPIEESTLTPQPDTTEMVDEALVGSEVKESTVNVDEIPPAEEVVDTDVLETPLVNPMLNPTPAPETSATEASVEETPTSELPAGEVQTGEPEVETAVEVNDSLGEKPKSFNKEEMENYVIQLINEYNEKLKKKFNELVDNSSKELLTKLVDIPVFLDNKNDETKEKIDPTPVLDEPVIDSPLESVPVQEAPVEADLNPVSASVEETTEIPASTLEELPTLDSTLETMPALEAIQTQQAEPTPVPVEESKEELEQGDSVFPPASHDNLVEDAFNQINSMQIPSGLDNTPIQGKFL